MSPSYRRRKAKSTRKSSSSRRKSSSAAAAAVSSKLQLSSGEALESSAAAISPAKIGDLELELDCGANCSTPKAERFRIPEITTCPPAPRKRRLIAAAAAACSLRRRPPMAFFAPPDLELFFYLALRGIQV